MMNLQKVETFEALRALSAPAPSDRCAMTRRRFLQASAATAGAGALLPSWLADVAAAATPIAANEGVLVIVLMAGGNDGLSTVVPTGDGLYYDSRGPLAIAESAALPISRTTGLHPNLEGIQSRFTAGQVAVLQGVGDIDPDMSHFTALARWMAGETIYGPPTTGWLGRWLDGYGKADDLSSVVIDSSIPLALVGAKRKAIALPEDGGDAITADHAEGWITRSLDCLRDFGAAPTGMGSYADMLGTANRKAVDLADVVKPVYRDKLPGGKLVKRLELAARLVNANLGVRVVQVHYGDFDSHSGQKQQHDARMVELDAGIDRFFKTLSTTFAKRTTVLTLSEFGRRPEANDSGGTDHGEASDILAIGAGVKGGFYGEPLHLDHLSEHGCPIPNVDHRSVYATILGRWLNADAKQILGGSYEDLGFLKTPST